MRRAFPPALTLVAAATALNTLAVGQTSKKEKETQRRMFAQPEKTQGAPNLQSKTGREFPWITKIRKHCDVHIQQAADKLAAEAERFAEFHRMRAVDMQGK